MISNMHALHLASPNTNTVKSPHLDFIWIQSQQQNIQKAKKKKKNRETHGESSDGGAD